MKFDSKKCRKIHTSHNGKYIEAVRSNFGFLWTFDFQIFHPLNPMQPSQNKLHSRLLTAVTDMPSVLLHWISSFLGFTISELFVNGYFSLIFLYSLAMAALFITKWTTWLSGLLLICAQWGVDIIEHSECRPAHRKRKK